MFKYILLALLVSVALSVDCTANSGRDNCICGDDANVCTGCRDGFWGAFDAPTVEAPACPNKCDTGDKSVSNCSKCALTNANDAKVKCEACKEDYELDTTDNECDEHGSILGFSLVFLAILVLIA